MTIGLMLRKVLSFTHAAGVWGDEIYANALAKGLGELGHDAVCYGENLGYMPAVDLAVYFHLLDPVWDGRGNKNVYFAQNLGHDGGIRGYIDRMAKRGKVLTFSRRAAADTGAVFLPPCVDPTVFHQVPPQAELAADCCYVGNVLPGREARTQAYLNVRPATLALAGRSFGRILSSADSLALYSSCKIGLSFGFEEVVAWDCVIARAFQLAACGCFVVSDPVPYLQEVFGDTMAFAEPEQVGAVVQAALTDPKRVERAQAAQQIVLERFSPRAIAQQLLEACGV